MAIPTSADVRAGASFTPSPIMATFRPSFLRRVISASFCVGRTPAITSSIPTFFLIACAVILLSPVSIITCIPYFLNCETASALVGFTTSATFIIPIIL